MKPSFYEVIEANPVIAAVKDPNGLKVCCSCEDIKVVFILFGDICSIADITKEVKAAGKVAIVHVDLIEGLNTKEVSVDFIKAHTLADGIISTKPMLIKRAKELELYTILRIFVLDSMSYENIPKQISYAKPDVLEILPGLMPKVIKKICKTVKIPVIAGGLISDREDVMGALSAGAISVSSTNPSVWMM